MGTVNLGKVRDRVTGVEKIHGNGEAGTIDTYRVSFESSNYYDFNVTNGRNGVGQIITFSGNSVTKDNLIFKIVNNQDKVLALFIKSSEQNDGYMQVSFKVEKTITSNYVVFVYGPTGSLLFQALYSTSVSLPIVTFTFESGFNENYLNAWYLLCYNDSSTGLTIDTALSDSSTNPVQNKVVSVALEKLGNDVTDTIKQFTGNKKILDFEDKFITTNVGIGNQVDVNTLAGDNTWCHTIVECSEGDEFLITGLGGTGPRVATFTDSTYHALFISSGDMNNTKIVAPANSSYLIFNSKKSVDYQVIKNMPLVDVVGNVNDDLDTTILEIENGYRLLKEAKWQRGRVANGVFNPDVIYEISTTNILHFNKEITLKIASGYEINVNYFNSDGTFSSQQSGTSSGEVTFDHTQYFKITLRKVSYVTTEQANVELYSRNLLISTASNLEIWKKKYRYLVSTFYGTTKDSIIFLGTNDLRSFDLLAKKGLYKVTNERSSGLTSSLRDPAIIQIGEWYYFTYSVGGVVYGDTDIGFCRTKDFVNWEELSNLSMSVDGYDTDAAWAPSWFRNGTELFVVVTLHIRDSRFCTVIAKYNVTSHQFSDSHVIMDNTGIDYHIYIENGNFYACGSGGRVYKATNIYGPYEVITDVEVTNEADFVVKLDSGKWRRYKQELSAYNDGRQLMIYQDADTLESEWGSEHYVKYTDTAKNYIQSLGANINSALYYHWTIFDFNNSNNNNNNFTYEV